MREERYRNDRIEYKPGDRYYKIVMDGFVVALCPSEITAQMCFFALTTYKKDLIRFAEELKER